MKAKSGKPNRVRVKGTEKSAHSPEVRWEALLYEVFERVATDLQWDGNISRVKGAIRARDWDLVLTATKAQSPQLYATAKQYYAACQVEHLFKKLPIPGSEDAAELAAWNMFVADEKRNRRTNQKFRILNQRNFAHKNALYTRLLGRMQSFVYSALGAAPDLESVYGCCDFGPGSSVECGGNATHPYAKLDKLTATAGSIPYVLGSFWANHQIREMFCDGRVLTGQDVVSVIFRNHTFGEHTVRARYTSADVIYGGLGAVHCVDPIAFEENVMEVLGLVDYNKICFVEKNYRIKRTIASEPSGSGYVQAGLGVEIATLLRRFRPFINIWDQTRNQRMAERATLDRPQLPQSTIDLKSSSQSLATEMVKAVFAHCPDWFRALNAVRSPRYVSDHGNGRYELFCSMGNGFCFPLQTLIYAAAVEAVYAEIGGCTEYAVYGDDIIVDQTAALLLIEWLKYLGVKTNTDKTFVFGPFRESCGADFFDGINVRPYVLDFIPVRARDLIKVANGFSQQAAWPLWGPWWTCWYMMPQYVRKTIRPFPGPDDTGLTVPISFYDVHRLDEYDADLQRYVVRQYRSHAVLDDGPYVSKETSAGQALLAYRGASTMQLNRVATGRDGPVSPSGSGVPVPSFRRQTRTTTCSL